MKHHRHCRGWADENPTDHRAALKDLVSFVFVALMVVGLVAVIVDQLCR